MSELNRYPETFGIGPRGASGEPSWLRERRARAAKAAARTGMPTKKWEHWRYTDASRILRHPFAPPARGASLTGAVAAQPFRLPRAGAFELVVVNGRPDPRSFRASSLPEGLRLLPLDQSSAEELEPVRARLGELVREEEHPFAALNLAHFEGGVYLEIAPGVELARPVHLLHIVPPGKHPTASHPRSLVVLGANSRATLVETWATGPGEGLTFSNAVTEVALGPGASLGHHVWERLGPQAAHVGQIAVAAERDSRYTSSTIWLGGRLARNDLEVRLEGPGAEASLDGLYLVGGEQHVDNHTLIDHATPACTSTELYKGVLGGSSRAVFNGKIVVRPGAQGSDARLTNRNLMLSDRTHVDTKPELEIFADDVSCAHGTTVAQLDPRELFYLQSRGLPDHTALHLLTRAFADEITDRVEPEGLRAELFGVLHLRFHELLRGGDMDQCVL